MKIQNIEEAYKLLREQASLQHAVEHLNVGSQFTLSKSNTKASPGGYQLPLNVETEMEATALRAILEVRIDALRTKLTELGVTL